VTMRGVTMCRASPVSVLRSQMMSAARTTPVQGEQPIAMVSLVSAAGYRGEIRTGRHRLLADEGPEVGGDDKGPNPYQLVLAGLVQCTSATLRMYADRKGWDLGEIRVRARLLRTGDGATKAERIERAIRVSGALSDEQKARLADIADRTPVTRTLLGTMSMETTLQ
jgi:putative redox protein